MTIDEAKKIIKSECYIADLLNLDRTQMVNTALDLALKALEQQPSEDCINRKAIMKYLENITMDTNPDHYDSKDKWYQANGFNLCKVGIEMYVADLPSVTPKYTDEEIDKAQLVEQAYVDKMVELAVKELKTPKAEWTPVSERLPEEFICEDGYVEPSDYVLVLGDHGNYGVSRYWGNRRSKSESPTTYKDWMDLDWVVQIPIAWMPLPEPYKEESEEKE